MGRLVDHASSLFPPDDCCKSGHGAVGFRTASVHARLTGPGKPRGRQRSRLGQRGQAVKADGVVVLPVGLESVGSTLCVI